MDKTKHVSVLVTTKEQSKLAFFYYDSFKQDCINFLRKLSCFYDNTTIYKFDVREYYDLTTIASITTIITDNVLTVVSVVDKRANQFLRSGVM